MCVNNNNDTDNTTSLEQLKVRAWACMWMWGGSTTTTMCIPLEAIERCVQWSVWSKLSSTTAPTQKIPHHLYVSKYEYTNVCAWACMWVSEYVCVWRTKRRDWLYDAMERRLLALALGSWLLALGLSTLAKGWRLMGRSCGAKTYLSALPPLPSESGSWPLHPSEGLETNGAKLWRRRPISRLFPLFPHTQTPSHLTPWANSVVVLTELSKVFVSQSYWPREEQPLCS